MAAALLGEPVRQTLAASGTGGWIDFDHMGDVVKRGAFDEPYPVAVDKEMLAAARQRGMAGAHHRVGAEDTRAGHRDRGGENAVRKMFPCAGHALGGIVPPQPRIRVSGGGEAELAVDFHGAKEFLAGPVGNLGGGAAAQVGSAGIFSHDDAGPTICGVSPQSELNRLSVLRVELLQFRPAELIGQSAAQGFGQGLSRVAVNRTHPVEKRLNLLVADEFEAADECGGVREVVDGRHSRFKLVDDLREQLHHELPDVRVGGEHLHDLGMAHRILDPKNYSPSQRFVRHEVGQWCALRKACPSGEVDVRLHWSVREREGQSVRENLLDGCRRQVMEPVFRHGDGAETGMGEDICENRCQLGRRRMRPFRPLRLKQEEMRHEVRVCAVFDCVERACGFQQVQPRVGVHVPREQREQAVDERGVVLDGAADSLLVVLPEMRAGQVDRRGAQQVAHDPDFPLSGV